MRGIFDTRRKKARGYHSLNPNDPSEDDHQGTSCSIMAAQSTEAGGSPRGSTESGLNVDAAANAVFDYLPSTPEEYAAVEKKLVRRIDWTLMPVLIAMIVLK